MSLIQELSGLTERVMDIHAKKGNLKAFIDSFEDKHNSSASIFLTTAQQKKLMQCVADGHEVKILPFKSEDAVYKAEEDLEKKGWKLLGDGDNGGGQVEAIFTRESEVTEDLSEAKKKLIDKVKSINELHMLAKTDPRYAELAKISAQNLGGDAKDLAGHIQWLKTNAMETDEKGVVGEINGCRDLVKEAYEGSHEFEADFDTILDHLKSAKHAMGSANMLRHIADTHKNYMVDASGMAASVIRKIETAEEALHNFHVKMEQAK
jgi:hypothetical protein